MKIIVLGSGGYLPFPDAQLPSIGVQYEGDLFLMDCGEGTQSRLVENDLSVSRLRAILISHLHGDHVLGLPGVMLRKNQEGQSEDELTLGGPEALISFLRNLEENLPFRISYPYTFRKAERFTRNYFERVWVESHFLDHRIKNYGYVIGERKQKRKFKPDRARELDVPEGPLWNQLQNGKKVTLENGTQVYPDQVSDPPDPGASVVYLPDTRPLDSFPDSFYDPNVLIHDGMFREKHVNHAVEKGHSTAKEAARVAKKLNADKLILTHFSQRYNDLDQHVEEARIIFKPTMRAYDGMYLSV